MKIHKKTEINPVFLRGRFLFVVFFLLFSSCLSDNVTDVNQARRRLYAAYEAGVGRCEEKPDWTLWVAGDVYEEDLLNCENSLLGIECPPEEIPPLCIWLMIHPASKPDVDGT